MAKRTHARNRGLFVLAFAKFAHAFVILIATVAALNLLHKNVPVHVARWLDMARIDPDNRYMAGLLRKLRVVHTEELKKLSALGFFYVAMFSVEGIGLLLEKRWAEWLTLVATGLFIPIELHALWREPSAMKLGLLILNIVVVVFLAILLFRKNRAR